ncbi:MAG: HAD family phosphatase [Sedimentisphaerales bacterium]|nr:HAD family phosphatase [Sedimentisphaerales bacterium]
MEPIEAVVFDWGGVLIENPAPALMAYCARALSVSVEDYERSHSAHGRRFQTGQITEAAFWERVCGDLSRPTPPVASLWGQAFRAVYAPRAEVFALARRLRSGGIKTALLTNTEPPVMQYWHDQHYRMFDALVFSCAEGVAKPDPDVYRVVAQKLDVATERCVLIDDRQDFIDGASVVGMNGILYKDLEQVEDELESLGVQAREGR